MCAYFDGEELPMPISDGFYKSKISGNGWVLDVHHVSQPRELVPFCVKGVAARARKRARKKPLAVDSSDDDDDQRDGDGEDDEEEGNMEDDDEDDDADDDADEDEDEDEDENEDEDEDEDEDDGGGSQGPCRNVVCDVALFWSLTTDVVQRALFC